MFRYVCVTSIVALSGATPLSPLLKLDADLASSVNKERPMENPRLFEGKLVGEEVEIDQRNPKILTVGVTRCLKAAMVCTP